MSTVEEDFVAYDGSGVIISGGWLDSISICVVSIITLRLRIPTHLVDV